MGTVLHGSQQHPESVDKYTKRVLDHPAPPGYPVVGYSLIPGQLSSSVWLDQPKHKGNGAIPPAGSSVDLTPPGQVVQVVVVLSFRS